MKKHKEDPDVKGWGRLKLFDSIGGKEVVQKIVDEMYVLVMADPLLRPKFEGVSVKKIVENQYLYLSASMGGPSPWTGRSLEVIHKNMGINDEQMNRYVDLFKQAAMKAGRNNT
jgi:truncated hemoglobin YjbI